MFCSKCGKKTNSDAEFCSSCGSAVVQDNEDTDTISERSNSKPSEKSVRNERSATKMNFATLKKYAFVAAAVLIIVITAIIAFRIGGFLQGNPLEIESETVVNITTLEHQILTIGEIATLQYYYRNLIVMEDSHKIFGWNIPLTQKSFIIRVDGVINIGIDASEIIINANENTKTIQITIPSAKILSHELKEETMVILDESSGLFNPVSIEDWSIMAVEEKGVIEEEAKESDMFTRAEEDAVRMLQALIEGVVPDNYTVIVKR